MARTTLFVFVLFSLFLISLSELESESIAAVRSEIDPSDSDSNTAVVEYKSESNTALRSEIQEPDRTVLFHPSEQDSPLDPDQIAHSFRLPNQHHRRHHHHGSLHMFRGGYAGWRPRVEFPVEMKTKEDDSDSDMSDDEDEIEHKRKKKMMKRMRKMRGEEKKKHWGFVERVRHFLKHLL